MKITYVKKLNSDGLTYKERVYAYSALYLRLYGTLVLVILE